MQHYHVWLLAGDTWRLHRATYKNRTGGWKAIKRFGRGKPDAMVRRCDGPCPMETTPDNLVQFCGGAFRVRPWGLEVQGRPTVEEWQEAAAMMLATARALPFAMAGLEGYGADRPGFVRAHKAAFGHVAASTRGFWREMLKMPEAIRALAPSVEYLRTLLAYKMTPAQREFVLRAAVDEGLTLRDFRQRIKTTRKGVPAKEQRDYEALARTVRALEMQARKAQAEAEGATITEVREAFDALAANYAAQLSALAEVRAQ